MSEEQASQSLEAQNQIERDADTEALFDSFGLPPQKQEKKDVEFPNMDEPTDPAIDQEGDPEWEQEEEVEEKPTAETRKYKIKFNKEEVEVDETQVPDLLEKGMALDKTRAKLAEQQKALDEIAQLQGYRDHADLLANLPKLKEQQQQKEKDQFNELRQKVIDELVYNGVSQEDAEAFADNNPLVKTAKAELQKSEERALQEKSALQAQEWESKWNSLYQAYPDLVESAKSFQEGQEPEWYNADMKSRIEKGYDPVDAYRLAHSDKIQTQTKKATEQKLIKQQQLGLRGHVNEQTATPPDEASLLPAQIALAEEFGVDIKGVQKQNQLLKNRR